MLGALVCVGASAVDLGHIIQLPLAAVLSTDAE